LHVTMVDWKLCLFDSLSGNRLNKVFREYSNGFAQTDEYRNGILDILYIIYCILYIRVLLFRAFDVTSYVCVHRTCKYIYIYFFFNPTGISSSSGLRAYTVRARLTGSNDRKSIATGLNRMTRFENGRICII